MQEHIATLEGNNGGGNLPWMKRKAYDDGTSGDKDSTWQKERILTVVIVHTAANVIGDASSSTNNNSQVKFDKTQQQYINQLVEAVVEKTKGKAFVMELDEDDEWSKCMTADEHKYVLSAETDST